MRPSILVLPIRHLACCLLELWRCSIVQSRLINCNKRKQRDFATSSSELLLQQPCTTLGAVLSLPCTLPRQKHTITHETLMHFRLLPFSGFNSKIHYLMRRICIICSEPTGFYIHRSDDMHNPLDFSIFDFTPSTCAGQTRSRSSPDPKLIN
ncbi:hypothetical protein J3E68DRAFT_416755 [Trichoderma sp. SZMC 28012]